MNQYRVRIARSRCCGNWYEETALIEADSPELALRKADHLPGLVIAKTVLAESTDGGKTWREL